MPKADRLFVYAVASWITRVDGEVDESETAMLDQLGEALRIPEKPRALAAEMAKEISELEDGAEPAFFNLPKLRRTIKARLADAQSMRAKQKEAAERGD